MDTDTIRIQKSNIHTSLHTLGKGKQTQHISQRLPLYKNTANKRLFITVHGSVNTLYICSQELCKYKGSVGSCPRVLHVSFFQLFPSGSPIVLDPRGKLGSLGAGEEFGDNQGWYIMVIFMSACTASHGFSHKKCLLMQTVHCRSGYICEFKL